MHRRSLLKGVLAAAGTVISFLLARFGRAQTMMPGMGGMMEDHMGGMMRGGMGDMMGPMRTGMQLFRRHAAIRRNVTVLSDGVRAVTESDDPEVGALIQRHVADMYTRIDQDRPFAYPMSRTVPVLFQNTGRYRRQLEVTPKGVAITETASDPDMVELIKAHAREITGFVDEGMPAMMRNMMQ
ncbi:hypothetical protein MTX26_02640 [Bradyrhizobium sp. ISRA443]|uniref:hypothetical protein n=1 Tax=unclassified Bradyrhizobium TaxID=2631580 RepID=UPI002478A387|nr:MULTISPECIES: hypothetical protein [unclassified Bradyrhizobium]WGR99788.1 hypothetical protein MTX23_02640 [Bradyrhizobium sp. ISRA436]WGS06678.1 hypothetical protein MTX18_02640 [Bradyrhizobium sp. ISRA437]WGS13562.1 hypothetical protein MTX26_02640 [Bradyrhizobium sp. ISRA443]